MKKIILSAVILVSVCISANAQFNFGIKAGVNSSTISSSDLKTSSVTGLQGGVFFRFGKRFFVQPELYVSSTGGSFTSQDNAYSATARFTNMSLPLLLGVALGAKSTKFSVFAGLFTLLHSATRFQIRITQYTMTLEPTIKVYTITRQE